jgi:hypothetical protein
MKLVTSSRASVRAALNVAAARTVRSSAVWHCGSRSRSRLSAPAAARPPVKVPMIAA